MKQHIVSSLLFCGFASLSLVGCGEGLIDMQNEDIQEQGASSERSTSELMYLRDAKAVGAAFQGGEAVFFPKQAFFGLGVMITAKGTLDLSYRVKDTEGNWSEWTQAQAQSHDDQYHNFHVEVPQGATALALKTGMTTLDFVRLEFARVLHTEHQHDFLDDPVIGESHEEASLTENEAVQQGVAKSGRWALSSEARRLGEAQYVRYDSAPAWNGGRNCSGTFTKGARDLGNYLVQTFSGAKYFQGYNCRQIRGRSGMSMHGTGRAIDVFVPLDRGQADNTLGDPIGEWLIKNAEKIGVQYIVYDRTSWGGSRSGRKDRYYSGAHPHHDHYHIELTRAGAARQTQWFKDRGSASEPIDGPSPDAGSCHSNTLGKRVQNGESVQVSYKSRCANNNTCGWYMCSNGNWTCTTAGKGSKEYAHASCQPAQPQPPTQPPAQPAVTCKSSTLGRDVPAGEYVQMPYAACASQERCQWAVCGNDGKWKCEKPAANATTNPHAQCAAPTIGPDACNSSTLGRKVAGGARVQMAYEACGGKCQWAECRDTKWFCVDSGNANASYPHSSCR